MERNFVRALRSQARRRANSQHPETPRTGEGVSPGRPGGWPCWASFPGQVPPGLGFCGRHVEAHGVLAGRAPGRNCEHAWKGRRPRTPPPSPWGTWGPDGSGAAQGTGDPAPASPRGPAPLPGRLAPQTRALRGPRAESRHGVAGPHPLAPRGSSFLSRPRNPWTWLQGRAQPPWPRALSDVYVPSSVPSEPAGFRAGRDTPGHAPSAFN